MGLKASDSGGGSFELPPEGAKIARCVQEIDIGHQWSDFYKKTKHKVIIGWELPSCSHSEGERAGEPMLVWKRYTVSLHENSLLRKDLQAWRGKKFTEEELKGFDLPKLLDKPCQVSIVHVDQGGKTYANVDAVMALGEGQKCPDRNHDLVLFDIDAPDMEVFASFGDNLKKTIENSTEWKARKEAGLVPEPPDHDDEDAPPPADDDEIPF